MSICTRSHARHSHFFPCTCLLVTHDTSLPEDEAVRKTKASKSASSILYCRSRSRKGLTKRTNKLHLSISQCINYLCGYSIAERRELGRSGIHWQPARRKHLETKLCLLNTLRKLCSPRSHRTPEHILNTAKAYKYQPNYLQTSGKNEDDYTMYMAIDITYNVHNTQCAFYA